MRRLFFALFAFTVVHALPARADDANAPMAVERSTVKGTAAGGSVVQVTGTIQAINMDTREITIKGAKGRVETMKVGPDAKNFEKLKVGDKVVARFYQGVALTYMTPEEAAKAATPEVSGAVETTAGKPGGAAVATVRGVVTVDKIDMKSRVVTLVGPQGGVYRVKAGPEVQIDKLKVGDKIYAVYQEGLAIDVHPAKK